MSIFDETILSLHDATQLIPSNCAGKRINFSTVWRWALKGIIAQDGTRVRLEIVKCGGRRLTSKEALERFVTALTTTSRQPELRMPAARIRANEAAQKKLARLGIN